MEDQSTRRFTVLSGLAFAVLFGVGSGIWGLDMPDAGTPVDEVMDFYDDHADRIVIGGSLSMLAIAAVVPFAAGLRNLLKQGGAPGYLADTAFGGALLTAAAGLGAESLNLAAALRARDGELTEPLGQALFEISQMLGSAASGVGGGVLAIATGLAALRAGAVLPRPVALMSVFIGVVLLSPLAHWNLIPGALLVVLAVTYLWALRDSVSAVRAPS